jgi:hypothetical protein
MSGIRPEVLKVTAYRRRRKTTQETFELAKILFNGYRVESSALTTARNQKWRDEIDLLEFPKPTPERIEKRLRRHSGRKKGRVLKLYQAESLVAVLSLHIDRKGHVVVLHAASRGLSADREMQLRILLSKLGQLNRRRAAGLRDKPLLWHPQDLEQMSLAKELGFDTVHQHGNGNKLPVLRAGP